VTSARDDVLSRIRRALADAPAPGAVPREYRTVGDAAPGSATVIERFVDRLVDYKATVHRTPAADLATKLGDVLGDATSVVVPAGLPDDWRSACRTSDRTVTVDGEPAVLTAKELDAIATVVTACRVAIAETGTIVLDAAPDQGRRALSLVPDRHVIVVFATQVVATVPESLTRLEPTAPLTFISGPSATSDIEFKRVEGVHGPRTLDVILVD
jgi:L-lactate dehydrogenase complex protein LldG